jgi:hypothetical protein
MEMRNCTLRGMGGSLQCLGGNSGGQTVVGKLSWANCRGQTHFRQDYFSLDMSGGAAKMNTPALWRKCWCIPFSARLIWAFHIPMETRKWALRGTGGGLQCLLAKCIGCQKQGEHFPRSHV